MSERSQRVVVYVAGHDAPEHTELADGEELLIGRSPDWARVESATASVLRTFVVGSPSVSANHARLRRRGDRVILCDLASRNGTWLALPPDKEITSPTIADPLVIRLAPPITRDGLEDLPIPVEWSDADDYVAALRGAITKWLDARDLSASVTVVARDVSANPRLEGDRNGARRARLSLSTGVDLVVEPIRTVSAGWLDAFARLERYVAHHNLLFETEEAMRAEGLVVASRAMRAAVARVVAAARSGARSLLLTGPSGAGKEGLARCFHRHTGRAGAFVGRNCALFGKDLVRAELFGADKGSFTGSVQRIVGAVEAANEGTLFLDEIGELPREVQPMFLRFLDRGEYERLGNYGRPKIADVRIVAATNRDLRAASLNDEFRMDLWFRLSVHVVEVPPLRDRPEDLIAYLSSFELPNGRSLLDALAPGTLDVLTGHAWEGNFRELTNFAQRIAARAATESITADAALESLREGALQPSRVRETSAPDYRSGNDDVFAAAIETARAAFAEDHDGETPRTWDQIKDLIENYVKPILFATLSDSVNARGVDDIELRAVSDRLRADRGTALKQLRRFFDRFGQDRLRDG